MMATDGCGCGGAATGERAAVGEQVEEMRKGPAKPERLVDYRVTLLIAAGAAMAANCEPCLNKIVPDLIEAGVHEADIRRAVEIGQFVKDKPAQNMKEVADLLTGTRFLAGEKAEEGCPAEKMKAS